MAARKIWQILAVIRRGSTDSDINETKTVLLGNKGQVVGEGDLDALAVHETQPFVGNEDDAHEEAIRRGNLWQQQLNMDGMPEELMKITAEPVVSRESRKRQA